MYADGEELVIERVFDAPPEVVWAMMTTPEHIAKWWGPHGTTTEVVEMEVRPGGRWRWINRYAGGEAPFTGEYLEVLPYERLVRTSVFDVDPVNRGPGAVETITFEPSDGSTKVVYHTRFPSEDVLAYALGQGMTTGALEQFDRLAGLLPGAA
jgi:uncharacterized protein YndB with AHSA1/START domain